ncbi:hypothetical protein PCANC_20256 [Puccinia coronata f. sp. avenae]|uniref:Uncharacterized protein n=1 Tax=Puccinia coronata f. sp. avenae TaxID=200324 RepID=A0A2N5SH95_9BASI|nr:hypothetical protein PCANC_20256 [Puccinia coronata f. sp. avenae]
MKIFLDRCVEFVYRPRTHLSILLGLIFPRFKRTSFEVTRPSSELSLPHMSSKSNLI